MRRPTLFALLLVALLARGASPNSCAISSEGDVTLPGSCTSAKLTLFSETGSISIKIEGTGIEKSLFDLDLKVGGCDFGGSLIIGSSGSSFTIDNVGSLKLSMTATVTKSGISFTGTPIGPKARSSFPKECSPVFKKVDGGLTVDVESTLSEVVAGFKMIFKKVRDYSKVAQEGGWPTWAWVLIVVGAVIFVLCSLILGLFRSYRWWKNRKLDRAQAEAALKKPAEKKPAERTKPAEKKPKSKPVIKKVDEVKPKTPKTSEQSVRSETSLSSRLFST